MQQVAVVDYGGSNLRSVVNAVATAADGRCDVQVAEDAAAMLRADRVVFPGQGAIGDCMRRLQTHGLIEPLRECLRTRPFFGICLGLQSLLTRSDEDGGVECLNVYAGDVRRFPENPGPAPDGSPRKIPHMGWNQVRWTRSHPVLAGIANDERFYFVHSYHVVPRDAHLTVGQTDYIYPFTSALSDGFVFATQFHPEKSAAAGLRLLKNFLSWNGQPL